MTRPWQSLLDERADAHIEELNEFVRIPGVSMDPAHRDDVRRAASWVAARLVVAGGPGLEVVESAGHPAVIAS